jgi:hypothetical protein
MEQQNPSCLVLADGEVRDCAQFLAIHKQERPPREFGAHVEDDIVEHTRTIENWRR